MKIILHLQWVRRWKSLKQACRFGEASAWIGEYAKRTGRYAQMEIRGALDAGASGTVWICDRGKGARMLTSEDLARHIRVQQNQGGGDLHVLIGGPDGFQPGDLAAWNPALRWSFGPLTLPHELAAVVAAEQLYRAFTINHNHPYHQAH